MNSAPRKMGSSAENWSSPRRVPPVYVGLPEDLLQKVSNRLRVASFIYGIGFFSSFFIRTLTTPDFSRRETFTVELVTVLLSVAIAAAVYVCTKLPGISSERLIDIGLIFEAVGAFGVAFTEQWGIFGSGVTKLYGISWICVWIIVFPLIVPGTPGKTLLAALVSATMPVFAHTLSVAFGKTPRLPQFLLIELFYPNYVSALIAYFSSQVIYRMRSVIQEARKMGCYELEELLGQGGMGEVWRARHRFLSRPAAIKLIRPEALGAMPAAGFSELQRRFEREAEATASLRSPHSVMLYDFGITEAGEFYYVMELLQGVDLDTLVRRIGPLSADRTVYILRQACHSLMDAHARGLIHRDIKPANLYLCRQGPDYDFVKLLDFGLVKADQASREETNLSVTGFIVGTPAFIAPEAIVGRVVDSRADIYSLGCLAYWLLTGNLVFACESRREMLYSHLNLTPALPSQRTENQIPQSLETIVMSCLAKDPQSRCAASDLLMELDSSGLGATWTNARAKDWWELHFPAESNI